MQHRSDSLAARILGRIDARMRGLEGDSAMEAVSCCLGPFILFYYIEVQLMYNVVLVSGVQHSDSVLYIYICIYVYIYILFQTLFPYKLLQNIEYSSLRYTVGPCCVSVLYIVVCIC